MIDEHASLDDPSGTGDTVAEAAAWLCADLGISMPPLSEAEIEDLEEIVTDKVFATDAALAQISSRDALHSLTEANWPPSGVAFGLLHEGFVGRWFHVRVSRQMLVLISLRIRAYDPKDHAVSLRLITSLHDDLARRMVPGADLAMLVTSADARFGLRRVLVTDDFSDRLERLDAACGPTGLSAWSSSVQAEPDFTQEAIWIRV